MLWRGVACGSRCVASNVPPSATLFDIRTVTRSRNPSQTGKPPPHSATPELLQLLTSCFVLGPLLTFRNFFAQPNLNRGLIRNIPLTLHDVPNMRICFYAYNG
jgi:hypothetical protein